MKRRSQTRSGGIGVLVLLTLVVSAVGAQAAFAQSGGSQAFVTPAAGTEGRGGVDAITQAAAVAAEPITAHSKFTSRARGGFPSGPVDGEGTIWGSSRPLSAGWVAAGLVTGIIALAAGFFAWSASRRRVWQQQSSLASYCAYHPVDVLC
jgi:hypothetical protein